MILKDDPNIYAYKRQLNDETLLVVNSFSKPM